MRDISKAIQTDLTLRRYEQLLEEAADDERIFAGKLAAAQRSKAYWQRRIAETKDELQSQSAA